MEKWFPVGEKDYYSLLANQRLVIIHYVVLPPNKEWSSPEGAGPLFLS